MTHPTISPLEGSSNVLIESLLRGPSFAILIMNRFQVRKIGSCVILVDILARRLYSSDDVVLPA